VCWIFLYAKYHPTIVQEKNSPSALEPLGISIVIIWYSPSLNCHATTHSVRRIMQQKSILNYGPTLKRMLTHMHYDHPNNTYLHSSLLNTNCLWTSLYFSLPNTTTIISVFLLLSLHLLTIATSTHKVLNNNIEKKNIKVVTRNSPLMSLINQMRRNSFAFWLNKARTGGHWEPFLTAFSCKSAKLHVLMWMSHIDKR
jgi:hypothetical protein